MSHLACRSISEIYLWLDTPMGRHSKGARDAMMTRPPIDVGLVARKEAAARGMTISDYVAAALAREVGLPESFPMPPRDDEGDEELPLSA